MAGPVVAGKSDHWGSRFGFIMAAVGSSVGLGNLWRFPFTAGENGGSAFIVIYLISVLIFGLPVLMAEYALGRHGQRSSIATLRKITTEENKPKAWIGMGWLGAIASLLLFSFYIVISGWVFDYIPQSFSGAFSNFASETELLNASIGQTVASINSQITTVHLSSACAFVSDGVITQVPEMVNGEEVLRDITVGDVSGCRFAETTGNKLEIFFYTAAFLALNVIILARGVKGGIERAAEILMPAFFIMLLGLVVYACIFGDFAGAASFLLTPDFTKVTFNTVLAAVGQAFFSLSVGSCVMFTYGAYLTRETSIPKNACLVAGADTFVALIAGFAIFPIVFAFGLNEAGGPGLLFVTLPIAFGQMPTFIGAVFFTLALFAAFTSAISLLEVGVSWLEDQKSIGRVKGAIGLGLVMLAFATAYIFRGDLIDHADFLSGTVMLPLGGALIGIFAGWVVPRHILEKELGTGKHLQLVLLLLRFIIPVFITLILISGIYTKFFG
ncbi:sodium-dependent transporter [Ponticaulis koreensis]|uniref:sodium-dependent transporter n=1 Tax=Ponticaulis koreensis TaxID=1123045 RepID=UPI0003B497AB|nr:sodium-dependent transporter [Ponticaulis koreensis]